MKTIPKFLWQKLRKIRHYNMLKTSNDSQNLKNLIFLKTFSGIAFSAKLTDTLSILGYFARRFKKKIDRPNSRA